MTYSISLLLALVLMFQVNFDLIFMLGTHAGENDTARRAIRACLCHDCPGFELGGGCHCGATPQASTSGEKFQTSKVPSYLNCGVFSRNSFNKVLSKLIYYHFSEFALKEPRIKDYRPVGRQPKSTLFITSSFIPLVFHPP